MEVRENMLLVENFVAISPTWRTLIMRGSWLPFGKVSRVFFGAIPSTSYNVHTICWPW